MEKYSSSNNFTICLPILVEFDLSQSAHVLSFQKAFKKYILMKMNSQEKAPK